MNRDALHALVRSTLPSLDGWCTEVKALAMHDLVLDVSPKLVIEIGVFGGKSLLPQAIAMRALDHGGLVVGIDPWTNTAAVEDSHDPANNNFWGTCNLDAIRDRFLTTVNSLSLQPWCICLTATAAQAFTLLARASVDVLHIDGNHSEATATYDTEHYLPLVRPGGYVWFDDTGWTDCGKPTMTRSLELVRTACREIKAVDNWALFQKLGVATPEPAVVKRRSRRSRSRVEPIAPTLTPAQS